MSYAANTGQIHNVTFELDGRKCTIMLEDKLDVNLSIFTVLKQGEDVELMIGWDKDACYKFVFAIVNRQRKAIFWKLFSQQNSRGSQESRECQDSFIYQVEGNELV